MVRGLVQEIGIAPHEIGFFTQNDAYVMQGGREPFRRCCELALLTQPINPTAGTRETRPTLRTG